MVPKHSVAVEQTSLLGTPPTDYEHLATLDDLRADGLAGTYERDVANTRDETEDEVRARERVHQAEAKLRLGLADPKRARAIYRDLAEDDRRLPHARFRVLSRALKKASRNLTNSFESPAAAARALGMGIETYKTHFAALKAEGYVDTVEFRYANGRQAKGSGIQFGLPGRLFASGQAWWGPRVWDNRRDGALLKPARKTPRTVGD